MRHNSERELPSLFGRVSSEHMPKGSETGDARPCSLRRAGVGEVLQRDSAGTLGLFPLNTVLRLGEVLRSSKDKDLLKWPSKNGALDLSQLRGSLVQKRIKPT